MYDVGEDIIRQKLHSRSGRSCTSDCETIRRKSTPTKDFSPILEDGWTQSVPHQILFGYLPCFFPEVPTEFGGGQS